MVPLLVLASCKSRNEVQYTYDPVANIDALYKIIDEKYCFLDEKNIDWDAIHTEYRDKAAELRIDSTHKQVLLFDLMASMLDSLRDGHVNLYTPFDISRNSAWYDGYPANYNGSILSQYYLTNSRVAGGITYTTIDNDSIGYIYYNSFSNSCSDMYMYWVFTAFQKCRAIIIDVRQNGGGDVTNAYQLASPFFQETRTIGYWQHKTGPGHNDYSKAEEMKVEKNERLQWQRPVVVLSNRRCYSATNLFISAMRQADNCLIIGGKSGGGGGMPLSYELPCGWMVRFSSVRMFDTDMHSIEDGIDPDVSVTQTSTDRDDLIEKAITLINNLYDNQPLTPNPNIFNPIKK